MTHSFHAIHSHGFVRVAACTPAVAVGDPGFNAAQTLALAREGHAHGCDLMLFPELGLSAYAIDDLFLQDALLARVDAQIAGLAAASADLAPVLIVGAPVRHGGALYNAAVVIHRGKILGVVPKSFLPNYREFYENRWFAPGAGVVGLKTTLAGQSVPFGTDLVFEATDLADFSFAAEICEDLWSPTPPSTQAAATLAGALILLNLSASNIVVGKADDDRELLCAVAIPCAAMAAYLYSAYRRARGEHHGPFAWDGPEPRSMKLGKERWPRPTASRPRPRWRWPTSTSSACAWSGCARRPSTTPPSLPAGPRRCSARSASTTSPPSRISGSSARSTASPSCRTIPPASTRTATRPSTSRCRALAQRLRATKSKTLVIGISGGLDSTHALLVACKAFDALGKPRSEILGFTMPGFATSEGTKSNAWALMNALGVTGAEIDIKPAALRVLEDIGHPYAKGEKLYDVTFENVQAGLRTDYLFRLANQHSGLVLGTGDLSEIALGWNTYGVGDQMSHYNVNGSLAKSLIQHLIRWVVKTGQLEAAATDTLLAILDTEISPELVPADASGAIQSTQAKVGPYELQDFSLFHITRYGLRPSKVAFLAWHAWRDVAAGRWPPNFPEGTRNAYDLAAIKQWLGVFLFRFFEISQFKRSAMPNGPKVISGGALSPRGDWRAPSDGTAKVWLEELEAKVP